MIAGFLAPGLGRLFYFQSIEKLGASITASIWSTFPLYTTVSAVFFLNEKLSSLNWLGLICMLIGVLFIERSSNPSKVKESWFSKKQLIIPIIGTLFMASSSVIRKFGLNLYHEPVLGTAIGYLSSLIIYLLYIGFNQSNETKTLIKNGVKKFWKAAVAVALTSVLIYYALSLEQVAIVTPVLQVNTLFTLLFAYFFLKKVERISLMTGISALTIFLGIILLGI
jgi:drug/metabolite transporter (DMT)-like permease